MSHVKRLLEQATPLPWRAGKPGIMTGASARIEQEGGTELFPLFATPWRARDTADAELIVHAVNHLANYEAAVEALDAFMAGCVFQNKASGLVPQMLEAQTMARAALRRLRGEVPA